MAGDRRSCLATDRTYVLDPGVSRLRTVCHQHVTDPWKTSTPDKQMKLLEET
jgi:hypothetical protein